MKKRRTTLIAGLVGILIVWLFINLVLNLLPDRPEDLSPRMQLAPYHEGMNLRQVFDTFPEYGAEQSRLRLLDENNLAWAARWDLLDSAKDSIAVSYFILKQDVFGVAFLGHLLKKAEEGVKVRILLDAFGSRLSWHPKGDDYLDALVNTGNVNIRMYRTLPDRLIKGLLDMSLAVTVASDHDKILVVDGKRAITGGRNISTKYFADPDDIEDVHIDTDVEIGGRGTARALTAAFDRQYNSDGAEPINREALNLKSQKQDLGWAYHAMDLWLQGETISDELVKKMKSHGLDWAEDLVKMKHLRGVLSQPLPPYMKAETHVLDSVTRFDVPNDTISRAATRLVKATQQEIFIQNPYVMLSDQAVNILSGASKRGIPITLFTNSALSGDSSIARGIFMEQWPRLLTRLPTLRLYGNGNKRMVHAKLATFDHKVSLVGTYNLSPLSMATNSEVVLAVWSPEFARALSARPRERLAKGPPLVYRYRIERNPDGTPRYDEDGNPLVAFGPSDHTDMDDLVRLQAFWKTLQAAEALPGVTPFF